MSFLIHIVETEDLKKRKDSLPRHYTWQKIAELGVKTAEHAFEQAYKLGTRKTEKPLTRITE